MTPPESSVIAAVRVNHSMSSKGEIPGVAKLAIKVRPLDGAVGVDSEDAGFDLGSVVVVFGAVGAVAVTGGVGIF